MEYNKSKKREKLVIMHTLWNRVYKQMGGVFARWGVPRSSLQTNLLAAIK